MITSEKKKELIEKFGANAQDSGASEVQVAILSERIANLTGHLSTNKKDFSSMRGMMKLIGQRKSLLKYISKKDPKKYDKLVSDLGLRNQQQTTSSYK
ncbi:MAG: 30S ribosomal protein S15 [Bacteriovoracaceae bacterium]|nr:30S ribosomal protein S15 [Bacteriovoracaceae bacterium]